MVSLRSINIHLPLSMLSKFAIICVLAVVLFPIDSQAQADLDVIYYYAQDGPKVIQDNGGYDGRTVWEVNLTGAPADAVIRSVDVEYWITHPWVGDLKVWLATEEKGAWIEYVLWDRQDGNANNIHEKETELSTWNDLPVNRKWYLCAADYVNMDEGRIDLWKIWVYFDKAGVVPQFIPYYEDFTEGKPDDSQGWEYYSNNRGRIEIVDGKLRMDDEQDGSSYSLNEAILHLDLSGRSGVILTLRHENDSDENTSLPSRFTGHLNGDGIAISPAGINWYLVTNLTSSFSEKSFDLDTIVQEAGISYTSDFRIKFQQYDNYGWPTDGRAFDNISVTATGADPQARTPFGLWNGTFNSTNYGVAGSINDWVMREDYTTQAMWELTVVPGTGIKVNPSGTFSFNPLDDSLNFLYTGQATILNDGQVMEVPGTLNVQGTVFRNRIDGNYTLRLYPPNLPPVIDNGTLQVNKEANIALHVFGIEISTGWNYNDPELVWNDLMYDFSLGVETDDTVSHIEFQTPKGYTHQIPSDSYTQVGDVQTWHYPVETTSPVSSPSVSGLVAYWKMDDNAADTTVTDSSDNGNHGVARQNTSVLSTAGKFDSALTFNGISDYIDCGNDSSLDLTDNFTIAAWIKPRSFSYLAGIVSKYHTPDARSYTLRLNKNSPYNKLMFGGHTNVTSVGTLSADQWYFVVGMRDSGVGKIYINGKFDASAPVSILSSSDSLYIGLDYGDQGDARYFDGAIDNVMIFNRTLSGTEINTLYNNKGL
jgi:subtilisin-like proprotein convertase family protein